MLGSGLAGGAQKRGNLEETSPPPNSASPFRNRDRAGVKPSVLFGRIPTANSCDLNVFCICFYKETHIESVCGLNLDE